MIPPLLSQDEETRIFTSEPLGCGTLVTDAISPIHLTDKGECFITVDTERSSFVPQTLFATNDLGQRYQATYNLRSNSYHFPDLSLNGNFALQYEDECSNVKHLTNFATQYAAKQNINVSEDLYELIADLSVASQRGRSENTQEAILNSSEIDDFEKAYFLQRYFLKGRSVRDYRVLLEKNSLVSSQAKMTTCNCENIIHTYLLNPGQLNNFSGNLVNGDVLLENNQNKLEYQLHTTGASKAWRVYSDGYRERPRDRTFGGAVGSDGSLIEDEDDFDQLPNDFSNEARLGMNLFCNGGATPANCGCDKLVRSRVMYESQVSVRAQLGSGSGSKSSFAAGEDIAIAYLLKRDGTAQGDFTYYTSLVARAEDDCQQDPNEEFWSSAVNATFGIATLIASFALPNADTSSQLFTTARLQIINQISSNISTVITNSPTNTTGSCSSQLQSANVQRIDIQPDIYLNPNTPTELGIATRARLVSLGKRSWQSEATLVSGFSIATVHPSGLASADDDPGCCSPSIETSYISRAHDVAYPASQFLSPISSQEQLQIEAATFIFSQSNSYFNFPLSGFGTRKTAHQFGWAIHTPTVVSVCTLEAPGPEDPEMRGSIDTFGNTGTLSDSFDSPEEYHLMYYNLNGQLIGESNTLVRPTPLDHRQFLRNKSLPAGIYLVALHGKKGSQPQVRKIHINQ